MRPEDPDERLERVDAFAGHVVIVLRARRRAPAPGACRTTTGRAGAGAHQPVPPHGAVALGPATRRTTTAAVTVVDQSYTAPPVWSDVDLATARAQNVHHHEAPGHDPSAYLTERMTFAAARRHRGRRHRGPAPGHPARRHGARAALRVRRVRGRGRGGVRPRAAQPARPGRGLGAHATSAAAARAAGGGGWTGGSSTSSTPSTTTSRSPTGSRAAGRRVAPRHPGTERRWAAPGRRAQPAHRTDGGRSSPRCRSSTWSPRCSTPRSR